MQNGDTKFIKGLLAIGVVLLLFILVTPKKDIDVTQNTKTAINTSIREEVVNELTERSMEDGGVTVENEDNKELEGFVYPVVKLDDPLIIFVPNDDVLRTFPNKVIYGIYCALVEGAGTDPSDFFVGMWEIDDDGFYNVKINFNTGASISVQIDPDSSAYKFDKTLKEAEDDYAWRQARGEEIFKFPQETVDKFIEITKEYTGLSNPELTTLNERNCCWVVWYNDAGVDRFIKLDKDTEEMTQRGHYDDLKEEYVVDWEVSTSDN